MKNNILKIAFDVLYFTVGLLCIAVSIKFSYQFFIYNGHNVLWSFIFAFAYIVFLNLLFEQGINYFIKNKIIKKEEYKYKDEVNKKKIKIFKFKNTLKGCLILFSWLLLTSYSVISTIGGQYEQLTKIIENEPEVMTENSIPLLEEKISLYKSQCEIYKAEIKTIQKRLSTIEDIEKSFDFKNTSAKNEKRLDELVQKLEEKNSLIMETTNAIISIKISSADIKSGNIYKYFEKITKIKANLIQFVLSFFPSIVVDFFSPISFAMFIFRRKGG